ncbi:SocA family protein [Patescibacteria group bacterium]|nr:SocA family protein [Patescibacteria group bacterium]
MNQKQSIEKYEELILHCLKFGGDSSDGKITKTKLAKLVYLSDFLFFYENSKPISGMVYKKIDHGPVPYEFFQLYEEMQEKGVISCELKGSAQLTSLVEDNIPSKYLSKEEIQTIEKVCLEWKDVNTKEIENFTHNQLPYKISYEKDVVPYELITQLDLKDVFRRG